MENGSAQADGKIMNKQKMLCDTAALIAEKAD